MKQNAVSVIAVLLIAVAASPRLQAESPLERQLQQIKDQHEAALNALLQTATIAGDTAVVDKIQKELAIAATAVSLEQALNDTHWAWFNSTTFNGDKHWIEFNADGTARCSWKWPLKWAIEGPASVLVRRTDTDNYVMHFRMDLEKLEGVADPGITKSSDPRSIRFERRLAQASPAPAPAR